MGFFRSLDQKDKQPGLARVKHIWRTGARQERQCSIRRGPSPFPRANDATTCGNFCRPQRKAQEILCLSYTWARFSRPIALWHMDNIWSGDFDRATCIALQALSNCILTRGFSSKPYSIGFLKKTWTKHFVLKPKKPILSYMYVINNRFLIKITSF